MFSGKITLLTRFLRHRRLQRSHQISTLRRLFACQAKRAVSSIFTVLPAWVHPYFYQPLSQRSIKKHWLKLGFCQTPPPPLDGKKPTLTISLRPPTMQATFLKLSYINTMRQFFCVVSYKISTNCEKCFTKIIPFWQKKSVNFNIFTMTQNKTKEIF